MRWLSRRRQPDFPSRPSRTVLFRHLFGQFNHGHVCGFRGIRDFARQLAFLLRIDDQKLDFTRLQRIGELFDIRWCRLAFVRCGSRVPAWRCVGQTHVFRQIACHGFRCRVRQSIRFSVSLRRFLLSTLFFFRFPLIVQLVEITLFRGVGLFVRFGDRLCHCLAHIGGEPNMRIFAVIHPADCSGIDDGCVGGLRRFDRPCVVAAPLTMMTCAFCSLAISDVVGS